MHRAKLKKVVAIIIIAVFTPTALFFLATGKLGHFAILALAVFLIGKLLKRMPPGPGD